MTVKEKKQASNKRGITAEDVLIYIANHPNLISENIKLFNEMLLCKKNEGNIITFDDIRIRSLIKENNSLKNKLTEIIQTATVNKNIQEKLTRFSNEIISFRKIELLIDYIEKYVEKEFSSIDIDIKLIKFNGLKNINNKYFPISKNFISFINFVYLEKKPTLINENLIDKFSLKDEIDNVDSVVTCPLGIEYPVGIILVKYKSEMMGVDLQFDLLNSLSETVSYSLEQHIQK